LEALVRATVGHELMQQFDKPQTEHRGQFDGAEEECPQEWGHSSLKGRSTGWVPGAKRSTVLTHFMQGRARLFLK
jgi:hypothetical protein